METKICTKCKENKPLSEYYLARPKPSGDGRYVRPSCKKCENARSREYHHKNLEDMKKRYKRWSVANKYGVTLEQYYEMSIAQDFKCAICGNACSSGRALAIDHDHKTGEVRGLLCGSCNNGLGRFKDDVDRLYRAIDYLNSHRSNPIPEE